MRDLGGRLAVVTGGGSGMGRELVRQLVAKGCNVAMCDVSAESMAETRQHCANERSPQITQPASVHQITLHRVGETRD